MRQLYQHGYDVADHFLAACAGAGYWLQTGDRILDFGCGGGALVYRFRDLGFDAYGFDIHKSVALRDPADARFFAFANGTNEYLSDMRIDRESFRIPFETATFDLIVSTSVLEHVLDLGPVMHETARLLKPSGFGYHLYPNRGVFIEPHIYVPLASRIQNRSWFYLWGLLGIRNEFQDGMTAREVMENNMLFARTGVRYRTRHQLRAICEEYFHTVRFVDDLFYPDTPKSAFWRNRWSALKDPRPFRALSATLKMGSLVTAHPVQAAHGSS
jgi:SAM-dependent methyltransferase